MSGHALPHDTEAERALLGAILIRPDQLPDIAARIRPTDWYGSAHAEIYRHVLELHAAGTPVDLVTLGHALRSKQPETGAQLLAYAVTLLDAVPRSINAPHYAEIVARMSLKRNLVRFAAEVKDAAGNGQPPDAVLQLVETYIGTLRARVEEAEPSVAALDLGTVLETAADEPVPWLIQGWLAESEMAYLAGEWGSGKSLVALDAALSLASGKDWMRLVPVTRPARVLYVDEEQSPKLARHRFALMARGRGINADALPDLPIRYLTRNGLCLDDPRGWNTIRRECDRFKPDLIVLDSLVRFFRNRVENDASDMADFFGTRLRPLMAEFGASLLALDHMGKPSKERTDPGHRQRGSSEKPGNADELWTLEGERTDEHRSLSHQKTRWDTLQATIRTAWRVSEDGTAAWIEAGEQEQSLDDVLLRAVGGAVGGITAGDLSQVAIAAGYVERTVRRAIGRLHGRKLLAKNREGKNVVYTLPTRQNL